MKFVVLCVSAVALMSSAAMAAEETSAIYAPKCTLEQVKEILGDKATKVEAGAAAGIYNITYDVANKTEVATSVATKCM